MWLWLDVLGVGGEMWLGVLGVCSEVGVVPNVGI